MKRRTFMKRGVAAAAVGGGDGLLVVSLAQGHGSGRGAEAEGKRLGAHDIIPSGLAPGFDALAWTLKWTVGGALAVSVHGRRQIAQCQVPQVQGWAPLDLGTVTTVWEPPPFPLPFPRF